MAHRHLIVHSNYSVVVIVSLQEENYRKSEIQNSIQVKLDRNDDVDGNEHDKHKLLD